MQRVVVIGSSGLLGRAVSRHLGQRHIALGPVDWSSSDRRASIRAAVHGLPQHESLHVLWCAGRGTPTSSADLMAEETASLRLVLEELDHGGVSVAGLTLISSAGALYPSAGLVGASSPVAPTTHYGSAKLAQEQVCRDWAHERGVPHQALRVSTVYGPGQSRAKAQGLVTATVRSAVHRIPLVIRVGLDASRDFIYSADAAAAIVSAMAGISATGPRVRLIASGLPLPVGHVLVEVARVTGRRPMVTFAPDVAYRGASAARFQPDPDLMPRTTTSLAAGIGAIHLEEITSPLTGAEPS